MPVRFDCHSCEQPWWSPPANGCPRCGTHAVATPDPIVWTVGRVPDTEVSISGQLLDLERFHALVRAGFDAFVDVAGDLGYVWRPSTTDVRAAGVRYVRVEEVEDTNLDLPDRAFDEVAAALEPKAMTLLFCAAGLKRSPHLMYGVLRRRGDDPDAAWGRVQSARPFTAPFAPYVAAAERWVSRASRPS